MAVVNTGFDPLFGDPLRKLIERAKAEGYNASILSGVRDDEAQRQLVANAAATAAGRPLPYPDRGPVRKAAAVGLSAHEYGTAGDVSGVPQAELQRLAPQVGLNTIPGDPGHVELANWRQVAENQPPPTPWSETNPANVPSRMAMNVDAPSAPPGTSLNSGPDQLASMVGTLESGGGRYSSAQPRSMVDPFYGQYPGFAKSYGRGAAGVNNYAQAVLAANPKASVGDFYAGYFSGTGRPGSPNFNNFDLLSKGAIQDTPGTPAAQKAAAANFVKNAGVDPNAPLASVVGAVGPGPGNVGPVSGFLPGQPTGQGGIGSDAVASKDAAAPAAPSIASQITGPLQALTKSLDDSGDQKQPQQGGDQAALQAQQAAAAYGQQRQMMLQQQAAQLLAATMARGQKPLSWNSAPPGAATGLQRPPMATEMWGGIPIPMPGPTPSPGMTLNSMGDPYG